MTGIRVTNTCGRSGRGTARGLALAGLAVGFVLASLPAQASHVPAHVDHKAGKTYTKVASQDPDTTGSVRSDADDGLNCDRSRKRLWVPSEGWIVRQVTTCY